MTRSTPAFTLVLALAFGGAGSVEGTDLGNCSDGLAELIADGLPDPDDVAVAHWEIVMEPDVEDGNPLKADKFSIRVPGSIFPMQVEVPGAYLGSLPAGVELKVEVGAIGVEDNATFTEADGFCNTFDGTCP